MARWQLLGLVAALCVCLGEGLQCYECETMCYMTRKNVTCAADQLCGTAKTYKGSMLSFTKESCVNKTLCGTVQNKTVDLAMTSVGYYVNYTCCVGEYCNHNSGNAVSLSLLTGISALVVMWLNI